MGVPPLPSKSSNSMGQLVVSTSAKLLDWSQNSSMRESLEGARQDTSLASMQAPHWRDNFSLYLGRSKHFSTYKAPEVPISIFSRFQDNFSLLLYTNLDCVKRDINLDSISNYKQSDIKNLLKDKIRSNNSYVFIRGDYKKLVALAHFLSGT